MTGIKPFELSLWGDRLNSNNNQFEEYRVCTVASDQMDASIGAFDVKLVTKVNGDNQLTFSMYYQFIDNVTGEVIRNEIAELLHNEAKLKLHYDGKWYDFIIKDVKKDSSKYSYNFTAKDANIQELSKNGYNLPLVEAQSNNVGTVTELGSIVLADTDWVVSENSDKLYETTEELVLLANTVDTVSVKKLTIDEQTGAIVESQLEIPNNKSVYVFYSNLENKNTRVQFLYKDFGGNEWKDPDTEDGVIKDSTWIECYYDISKTQYDTHHSRLDIDYPSFLNIDDSVKLGLKAKKHVYNVFNQYSPTLDRYVYKYTKFLISNGNYQNTMNLQGQREGANEPRDRAWTTWDFVQLGKPWNENVCLPLTLSFDCWITNIPTNYNRIEIGCGSGGQASNEDQVDYNGGCWEFFSNTLLKGDRYWPLSTVHDGTANIHFEYTLTNPNDIRPLLKNNSKKVRIRVNIYTADGSDAAAEVPVIVILSNVNLVGTYARDFSTKRDIPTLYQDICTGGRDINSLNGWSVTTAEGNSLSNEYEYDTTEGTQSYLRWIRRSGNILCNSGIFDNRKYIGTIAADQEWLVEATYKGSGTSGFQPQFITKTSTPITLNATEINSTLNGVWTTTLWKITTSSEIWPVISEREFNLDEKVQLQFVQSTDNTYVDIKKCSLFRSMGQDEDGNYYTPDNISKLINTEDKTTYYYYNWEDVIGNNRIIDKSELKLQADIDSTSNQIETYIPVYTCEKTRAVTIEKSNYFNAIQSICESFKCWADFDIQRDENGKITSKQIIFKEYINHPNYAGFKYGLNLSGITRTIKSDQIVTKLLVQPNNNQFAPNKICTIQYAGANPTADTCIYDMRYYVNKKMLDALKWDDDLYVTEWEGYNADIYHFSSEIVFETENAVYGTKKWRQSSSGSSNCDYEISTFGDYSVVKISTKEEAVSEADFNATCSQNRIPLYPGKYLLSCYARGNGAFRIGLEATGGTGWKKTETSITTLNQKDWTLITEEINLTKDEIEAYDKGNCYFGLHHTQGTSDWVEFYLPQLSVSIKGYYPALKYYNKKLLSISDALATASGTLGKAEERLSIAENRKKSTEKTLLEKISEAIQKIPDSAWLLGVRSSQQNWDKDEGSTEQKIIAKYGGIDEIEEDSWAEGLWRDFWNSGDERENITYSLTTNGIGINSNQNVDETLIGFKSKNIPINQQEKYIFGAFIRCDCQSFDEFQQFDPGFSIGTYGSLANSFQRLKKNNDWYFYSGEVPKHNGFGDNLAQYLGFIISTGSISYHDLENNTEVFGQYNCNIPFSIEFPLVLTEDDWNTYISPLLKSRDHYVKELPKAQEEVDKINKRIESLKLQYNDVLKKKLALNKKFFIKYKRFIQEGTWSNDKCMDPNLYYNDALVTLSNSSLPKVSYDIKVTDISGLEEYSDFHYQVGDETTIVDPDFFGWELDDNLQPTDIPKRETIIVSEATYNLQNPSKNTLKVQTYKTQFNDLFNQITASVQSVTYAQGGFERAAEFMRAVDEEKSQFITNALNNAAAVIQHGSTVTTDNTGIRLQDSIESNKMVHLAGGGVLLSNDGGKTWRTGITADGITADVITSGVINTGVLRIMNGNDSTFMWNNYGLTAYYFEPDGDRIININYDKGVRFNRFGIYGTNNLADESHETTETLNNIINNSIFALTWAGLKVSGNGAVINIGKQYTDDNELSSIFEVKKGNDVSFSIDANGDVYIAGSARIGGSSTQLDSIVTWKDAVASGATHIDGAAIATGTVMAGIVRVYENDTQNIIFEADGNRHYVQMAGWQVSHGWLLYSSNDGGWGADGSMLLANGTRDTGQKAFGGSGNRTDWTITSGSHFGVTKNGVLYADSVHLMGELTIGKPRPQILRATNEWTAMLQMVRAKSSSLTGVWTELTGQTTRTWRMSGTKLDTINNNNTFYTNASQTTLRNIYKNIVLTDSPVLDVKYGWEINDDSQATIAQDFSTSTQILIKKNIKYTMSCYARVKGSANSNTKLVMSWYKDNDNHGGQESVITTSWKRYSFTFTPTVDNPNIYFGRPGNNPVTYTIQICAMKLEEGDDATAWCEYEPDEYRFAPPQLLNGTNTTYPSNISAGNVSSNQQYWQQLNRAFWYGQSTHSDYSFTYLDFSTITGDARCPDQNILHGWKIISKRLINWTGLKGFMTQNNIKPLYKGGYFTISYWARPVNNGQTDCTVNTQFYYKYTDNTSGTWYENIPLISANWEHYYRVVKLNVNSSKTISNLNFSIGPEWAENSVDGSGIEIAGMQIVPGIDFSHWHEYQLMVQNSSGIWQASVNANPLPPANSGAITYTKITDQTLTTQQINTNVLYVYDTSRNLLFGANGSVSDPSVTIAGWNVNRNSLYSGTAGDDGSAKISIADFEGNFAGQSGPIPISNWRMRIGSKFGVTSDGTVYATGVRLSGEIEATGGNIGGFSINTNSLSASGIVLDQSGLVLSSGDAVLEVKNTYDTTHFDGLGIYGSSGYPLFFSNTNSTIELTNETISEWTVYVKYQITPSGTSTQTIHFWPYIEPEQSNKTRSDIIKIELTVNESTFSEQILADSYAHTGTQRDGRANLGSSYTVTLKAQYGDGNKQTSIVSKSFTVQNTSSQNTTAASIDGSSVTSTAEKRIKIGTLIYFNNFIVFRTDAIIAPRAYGDPFDTTGRTPDYSNVDIGMIEQRWNNCYCQQYYSKTASILTSDFLAKKNVENIGNIDELFFDQLQPVSFKYKENSSNRRHFGLIAQDLQTNIQLLGKTTQDYACFIEHVPVNGVRYGIRYEELIPLCIDQIQRLKTRVAELEARQGVIYEYTEKGEYHMLDTEWQEQLDQEIAEKEAARLAAQQTAELATQQQEQAEEETEEVETGNELQYSSENPTGEEI